jgi:hypothetical protein
VYNNPIFDYNHTPIPIDQTQVVISDTITLSPRTINEIRVGGNRRKFSRVPESLDQNWAQQLGIPNVPGQTMPGFMRTATNYLFDARFPEGREGEVTENMSAQEAARSFLSGRTPAISSRRSCWVPWWPLNILRRWPRGSPAGGLTRCTSRTIGRSRPI